LNRPTGAPPSGGRLTAAHPDHRSIPILPLLAADAPLVKLLVEKAKERQHIYSGTERGHSAADALQLDGRHLAYLLNTSFWASLRQEEGRPARGALTIADRAAPGGLRFSEPIIVTQESLVRLAPALGNALAAVELSQEGMPQVWGLLETAPLWQPVIRMAGPASIVVSEDRQVLGILRGSESYLIKEGAYSLLGMITGVLDHSGSEPSPDRQTKAEHLLKIVATMHRNGVDGTLLVVPRSGTWPEATRFRYTLDERSSEMSRSRLADADDSIADHPEVAKRPSGGKVVLTPGFLLPRKSRSQSLLADLSQRLLAQIGHLAASEGAVVLGHDLSLFGFGAELVVPDAEATLSVADAVSGAVDPARPMTSLGPGPDQLAARFVHHYPDCLAFVASRAGTVSLFAWVPQGRPLTALTQVQHLLVEY
jgi:Probable sensor domain DACNV